MLLAILTVFGDQAQKGLRGRSFAVGMFWPKMSNMAFTKMVKMTILGFLTFNKNMPE